MMNTESTICAGILYMPTTIKGKLLDKLMAKSFKTASSELTDNAVNHFVTQHT